MPRTPKYVKVVRSIALGILVVVAGWAGFDLWTCAGSMVPVLYCRLIRTPFVRLQAPGEVPHLERTVDLSLPQAPIGQSLDELMPTEAPEPGFPGLQAILRATWRESIPDVEEASLFRVETDRLFRAELDIASGLDRAYDIVLACLVNLLQVPCNGSEVAVTLRLSSDEAATVPIQLAGLDPGIHDVLIPIWLDPYADMGDPNADSRRIYSQEAMRFSIVSQGDFGPITRVMRTLPDPFPVFGLDGIALHTLEMPWESDGALTDQTYLEGRPGQVVSTFLHLFNKHPVPMEYGIVAFVDYEQQDFTYDGESRRVLYVMLAPESWYPLKIELVAPTGLGSHELVLLAEPYPRARMDLEAYYQEQVDLPLDLFVWSTSRVDLEVKP